MQLAKKQSDGIKRRLKEDAKYKNKIKLYDR